MPELDVFAPNYLRACERWPDAAMLNKSHQALQLCIENNAHGMVEHVKSFIECVCITVLGDFGEPLPSSSPTATELLVAALRSIGMQNTRGASKLGKVLSGFNRLADALSEMRNEHGDIAHGKDAFLDPVSNDHARVFVYVGDAILSILLNALEGKEPNLTYTREPYERFLHLHERIDRAVNVGAWVDDTGNRPMIVCRVGTGPSNEAIELRIPPSQLLFGIDRSAYVEILSTADTSIITPDSDTVEVAQPLPTLVAPDLVPLLPPAAGVVESYSGRLVGLRSGLADTLQAESLADSGGPAKVVGLVDSLLATAEENWGVDWQYREPLQARMKVALKRVLVHFGVETEQANRVAAQLVAWMRAQDLDAGGGSYADGNTTSGRAAYNVM